MFVKAVPSATPWVTDPTAAPPALLARSTAPKLCCGVSSGL